MYDVRAVRRGVAALLALLVGCPAPASVANKPTGLRLVVLVVVDQMPTWAFERDRHLFKGGFARLLHDGAYVRAGELPYANSFTAPGHASIGTGAPPSVHGILGNSWYRRVEGRERPAEYDADARVLAVGPPQGGEKLDDELGASARALRVDGIADVLRRASLESAHSVAIALKPRSSTLMTGRKPDLAIWYEPGAGGMTTSRAYAEEAPKWLVEHARSHPASRFFTTTWEPLDAGLLAREATTPDGAPGEGGEHGFGATFPHALATSDAPAKALMMTPFADELVADTAIAALAGMELGKNGTPDLLAVSFGAHDFAGHVWGPDSWEELDVTLRLDALLGKLFGEFDRRFGKDGWAVVLTSDHGATPLVERGRTLAARRIKPAELEAKAEEVLDKRFGKGPWVAKLSGQNLYLTKAFSQLADDARNDGLTAAAYALGQVPNIAIAARIDQLAGHCETRAGLDQAVCYSIVSDESGELFVAPAAGSLVSDYPHGTHHDAPFDDNRLVPILVMAPGLAPQQGLGSLLQVAPTVCSLLGIPAPEGATLPPLFGLKAR